MIRALSEGIYIYISTQVLEHEPDEAVSEARVCLIVLGHLSYIYIYIGLSAGYQRVIRVIKVSRVSNTGLFKTIRVIQRVIQRVMMGDKSHRVGLPVRVTFQGYHHDKRGHRGF